MTGPLELDETGWQGGWMEVHGCIVPLFRSQFSLEHSPDSLAKVRWYVAVGGIAELRCNGQRIGDWVLAPDHTDYLRRVSVLTIDPAPLLQAGANVLGIILGGGWYERHGYGNRCFRSQVELTWKDGSKQIVACNHADWQWAPGPWTVADIYNGEEVDGRGWEPGWDTIDGGKSEIWTRLRGVGLETPPTGNLYGLLCPLMSVQESIEPVTVTTPSPGSRVFDFGKNICGWCMVGAGPPGAQVTLRFSERIDNDGHVDMSDLRSARATDRYTFAGGETWEPRFTYHGFRYCEMTGDEECLDKVSVTARRISTPLGDGVDFKCSHKELERLVAATELSLRGNSVGLLSDCPSRDERQGWLGDGHAIIDTFLYLTNGTALAAKWLQDMLATQSKSGGRWANMAPPWPSRCHPSGRATWGRHELERFLSENPDYQADPTYTCALTLCAESLYRWTGDPSPLADVLNAFEKHLGFLAARPEWPLVRPDSKHGNVLACDADGNSRGDPVDKEFFDCSFIALEMLAAARLSDVTGRTELAERCRAQVATLAPVLVDKYYDPARHTFGSQNADGMALAVGLLPDEQTPELVAALVSRIKADGYHPRCHMLCGRYLLDALAEHGAKETAYRMITVEGRPGWMDLVERSGGTIGCHFNPERGSLNHPALGLAAGWVMRWLAGIRLETGEPGQPHLTLDPWLPDELDSLEVSLPTPAGTVEVTCLRTGGQVDYRTMMTVPPPPSKAGRGPA